MLKFTEYLTERNLAGTPGTEGKGRGISHVVAYLGPYMSAEDKENTIKGFHGKISRADLPDTDGEKYHPEHTTHELGSDHGHHKVGEKIKIQHAFLDKDTNRMMVQTRDHGVIPASKIRINPEDKRSKKTQAGLENEKVLSHNFGVMPAGAARNAYDFHWNGGGDGEEIRGKARHKTDEKPLIRGEAKRNSGSRMGVAKLILDKKSGNWRFHPKSDPNIIAAMMKAGVEGKDGVKRNILDHYNHHYKGQEVVPAGHASAAGTGVAASYLDRYNALHLHRTEGKHDYGTSFTLNDAPHIGETNVSHLSDKDIKELDGNLNFEKTNGGSVRITHSPNSSKFNELAAKSVTHPEHNASFMNPEHVAEFKRRFREASDKKHPHHHNNPTVKSEPSHGGKDFYGPDEKSHIGAV